MSYRSENFLVSRQRLTLKRKKDLVRVLGRIRANSALLDLQRNRQRESTRTKRGASVRD
jgi:hypothetical protein